MKRNEAMNRRDVLRIAGITALGAATGSFPLGWARGDDATTQPVKKVLFFTRSEGFQHSVVKRKSPDELSFAEQHLVDWGKKWGFDVTATKDGSLFTDEGLAPFDVIAFYTTGNLNEPWRPGRMETEGMSKPMPAAGKEALIKFVSSGKGFVGMHCATDTFHSPKEGPADPYIKLIGGEFVGHGKQQNAKIKVVDPNFIKGLADFEKTEEWYRLKNFSPDLHVILLQEVDGMQDIYVKDGPYPETWARMQDKGRVFYTSMGHRDDVWESDIFQNLLLGGLSWAACNVDHDVTPNLEQVAPEAMARVAK